MAFTVALVSELNVSCCAPVNGRKGETGKRSLFEMQLVTVRCKINFVEGKEESALCP